MSELWEVPAASGAGFPVSCLSRRTETWSKVVGTFYEDGTVLPLFHTPKTSPVRGWSGVASGLAHGSPVLAETWGCQPSPASGSLCLALSPSQARWGGLCGHTVQIHRYPIAARFLSPIFTQAPVGPSSCRESQASRCLLQGLAEEDGQWTACSRLAGPEGQKPRSPYSLPWGSKLCSLPTETCLPHPCGCGD